MGQDPRVDSQEQGRPSTTRSSGSTSRRRNQQASGSYDSQPSVVVVVCSLCVLRQDRASGMMGSLGPLREGEAMGDYGGLRIVLPQKGQRAGWLQHPSRGG